MNEMQVFQNKEFGNVRTVMIDNEPWLVGKDVAVALGYSDANHAILDHVDDDDRVNSKTQGQNAPELGQRGGWLINESGLYALCLSSKLPSAKKFKHWVTAEVLPTIRKHGAYATGDTLEKMLASPDFGIKLLTELKSEQEKRKAAEATIEEQKPKVLFAQAVETSKTSILIGELAKLIKQNGVDIGQNRLFAWMRENGYIIKGGTQKNMPTQKSMKLGIMEIKERTISNPDGSVRLTKTPKVTGKGQTYFVNKFLSKDSKEA